MAEDLQRYLKRLLPTVEGLEGIIVSDRDGVHLVEANDDSVSSGALKPPFLGTFSIASEQASKLGVGRNRSIISYYTSHQVVQFCHYPLVVTFIAKTTANTGLIYSVEEDMRDAIDDLQAAAEETNLYGRPLPGKGGAYLSAALLCMWDNIHGPKILSVWSREQQNKKCEPSTVAEAKHTPSSSPPSPDTLLSVAIHSLNNEPGRTDRIMGIESKFFVMKKHSIVAGAFIFTIEVNPGKPEVFSFILVLPHSEMSEYLTRFAFYEMKVQQLLKSCLIEPLKELSQVGVVPHRSQARVKECVVKEVQNMDTPVCHLAQLMHSLRYNCLPTRCSIVQTFLGKDLEQPAMRKYLEQSITCHLQSSGHTVVVGEDELSVTMMLYTLGLFLSDQERKLSRLTCTPPPPAEGEEGRSPYNYEPNLYLQGFVVSPESSCLPFTMTDIRQSSLPPCIIHIDAQEVRWVEMNIPYFLRIKEDNEKKNKRNLDFKDLTAFKDFSKEYSSRLVAEFVDRMKLLPIEGGVREAFVFQFLRYLKLKALALSKYVDAEPKSQMAHAGEQIVGVLALNRGVTDRSRINRDTLQQDLCLECDGDLHVVLAFAEKIRPNTYIDVLGDPQSHSEAVIREFEAF